MNFIKNIFSSLLGFFLGIGLLILVGFIVVIAMGSAGDAVEVKENTVLKLNLNKSIKEIGTDNPLENLNFNFRQDKSTSLKSILATIKKAKKDDRISGIYLQCGVISCGFAMMEEIRAAILDFKESGKFVYTYGEVFSEKGVYMASVADTFMVTPEGFIDFNGFSSQRMFFTGMLEKLEIKPQVFRVGDYKSAVEPFFKKKMSKESRQQTTELLDDIYGQYLEDVSKSRAIPFQELEEISNRMAVRNIPDALGAKLITNSAYYDEFELALKRRLGVEEDKKINFISLKKYRKAEVNDENKSKNKIAVLIAEGGIVTSSDDPGKEISSNELTKKLRKIREDEDIKAVVLRVNSPGGSALASDVIWREIVRLKEKKPVIASMSDVAASGGYYISMACDKIVALPTTITGSIGVFGLMFNYKDMANNKLGLTFDQVNTGDLSDLGNPTRDFTEQEKAIIQTMVEEVYETFTTKAAEGRNMPVEDLLKVASGRVWSGIKAKEIGLVDELGGLNDAVELAASLANIKDDYKVRYYDTHEKLIERILKEFAVSVKKEWMKEDLGDFYPMYNKLKEVKNIQRGILAKMPYELVIE